MVAKLASGILLLGVVLVGLIAQASSYLLDFTAPVAQGVQSDVNSTPQGEPGPHPVGVRTIVDDAPVPMTVWYPAEGSTDDSKGADYAYGMYMLGSGSVTALASYPGVAIPGAGFERTGGPHPLVILSHGFAISASSYAWLAEHLASHGMVVVAPHHDESLDPGALWQSTVNRPDDIEAVISYVDQAADPGGEFAGIVDVDRIAVAGHSYGGYSALAAAGARIDPVELGSACGTAGEAGGPLVFLCEALLPRLDDMASLARVSDPGELWPAWSEHEIDAVVSMAGDAMMFGRSGLAEIDVPVLVIGGTADTDSPFEWGTGLTYEHVSSRRKAEVALEGAAHLVFAGHCDGGRRITDLVSLGFCSDPSWDRVEAQALVKGYVTAFLLAELEGDAAAEAALSPDRPSKSGVAYRSEGY